MVDEAQRLERDPELKRVPNPAEPGEPDRAHEHVSDPVPGTGYAQKEAHKQEHDSYANSTKNGNEGKHNQRGERGE